MRPFIIPEVTAALQQAFAERLHERGGDGRCLRWRRRHVGHRGLHARRSRGFGSGARVRGRRRGRCKCSAPAWQPLAAARGLRLASADRRRGRRNRVAARAAVRGTCAAARGPSCMNCMRGPRHHPRAEGPRLRARARAARTFSRRTGARLARARTERSGRSSVATLLLTRPAYPLSEGSGTNRFRFRPTAPSATAEPSRAPPAPPPTSRVCGEQFVGCGRRVPAAAC